MIITEGDEVSSAGRRACVAWRDISATLAPTRTTRSRASASPIPPVPPGDQIDAVGAHRGGRRRIDPDRDEASDQ